MSHRPGRKHRVLGFNMIEIMIALAVAAIIMQITVTTYVTYVARIEVHKAIGLTLPFQQAIADYYADNGYFPGGTQSPITTQYPGGNVGTILYYTDNVTCTLATSACTDPNFSAAKHRQIEIYFISTTSTAPSLLGATVFMLRPYLNGNVVNWGCMPYDGPGTPLSSALLPKNCLGGQ